ncbi:MAG: hypothetical protein H8E62_09890 [Planctomycetes bacterium]|nr:hypothetical protein [Planctomycetota bacterium]
MKNVNFHNLIKLAQQETPPSVDVADGVLAALSDMAVHADPYRSYLWMSVASAAAAACILIAATLTQQSGDSVSEVMNYVSWVAQ